MKNFLRKATAVLLMASMGVAILPAQAAVISADEAVLLALPGSAERSQVADLLARADVQTELIRFGVDPAQAQQRVAALSDEEVARLYRQVETATAGGSVVGAVVFVFLVLLVTDILGLTKVFPFTRPMR